jgi:hypothetical protein
MQLGRTTMIYRLANMELRTSTTLSNVLSTCEMSESTMRSVVARVLKTLIVPTYQSLNSLYLPISL